jgi:hypothetical protein
MHIHIAWKTTRENIKIAAEDGYYKAKQHNPWFERECSKLF